MKIPGIGRKGRQLSSIRSHLSKLLILGLALSLILLQLMIIPAVAADISMDFLGWWGEGISTTGWHDPLSPDTTIVGSNDGQFFYPYGVATDTAGNVYVVEGVNARVQKFTGSGDFLGWWGKGDISTGWHPAPSGQTGQHSGNLDGELSYSYNLTVDASGNVYVADTSNNRIQKFDSSGNLVGWWGKGNLTSGWHSAPSGEIGGTPGSDPGQLSNPLDVAVDASGNVYVADSNNQRIVKFDISGNYLGWLGKGNTTTGWHDSLSTETSGNSGFGDSVFDTPHGVETDSSGNVYVADSGNSRIQKFNSAGVFQGWWGKGSSTTGWHAPLSPESSVSGSGDGDLDGPSSMSVDAAGNVWVIEINNHRFQAFTNTGVSLGWWGIGNLTTGWHTVPSGETGGSSGSGDGEFNFPNGVAVDSSGNVFVADTDNQRIQKFAFSTSIPRIQAAGGEMNGVDKTRVLLPWIGGLTCLILASGVCVVAARRRRSI